MITQEQADTADIFHSPRTRPCDSKQGPYRYRRNGATQRWKREPLRFRIPIKFGLYAYDYLTEQNSADVHTGADCPVAPEGHN